MMETFRPLQPHHNRKLPHWQVTDGVYFVTFRLKNSLPLNVINQLRYTRELEENKLLLKDLPKDEIKTELKKLKHLYFGKFDDLLDNNSSGPHFLKEPNVAKIVENSILHFDEQRYKVICYIIMSNHVHLVFYKLQLELEKILGSMKKFSARQINQLHGQEGRTVWMAESYDHIIWSRKELAHWVTYTLNNSTKARLVAHWQQYPYVYLRNGFEEFVL